MNIYPPPQAYYARPGLFTDPGEWGWMLDSLPYQVPALVKAVQGIMVHIFWAEAYGLQLSDERKSEVQYRWLTKQLQRLCELDVGPLDLSRPLEKRLVGNCRDFSTFMTAILRHQGAPARARCGFGVYFLPDHYEDHWVFEYWDAAQLRWVMVDAQLDDLQQSTLKIAFNPLDMPEGQFITGGKAWLMCRAGQADPDKFGIFEWHGMEFVRGNLLRDFLALNKVEILPWDGWEHLFNSPYDRMNEEELALMDQIAHLSLAGDAAFHQARALYENDPRFHPPFYVTQKV